MQLLLHSKCFALMELWDNAIEMRLHRMYLRVCPHTLVGAEVVCVYWYLLQTK